MNLSLRGLLTHPAILSSVIATALLFGIQQLGLLEGVELKAFDQMRQMRTAPGPDPRILIIAITKGDLQKWKQWPLTSNVLEHLLDQLERNKPGIIGLDLFRDVPAEPGYAKLLQRIKQNNHIIPVCKRADSIYHAIQPPSGIGPDRVGFSDIVEDQDEVIRRNLLFGSPDPTSPCATPYSFSFQLALHYLASIGIQPKYTSKQELQLGNTVLKRLQSDSGGYQNVDAQGFQILLSYPPHNNVANSVSLTQVLSGQVNPGWVKNCVVLIGATAPSIRDVFNTPYSDIMQDNQQTTGIILHAQMVSQILRTVVDQQPLFWFWPKWGVVLWSWGWSLVGGVLAWRIQHPLRLGLTGTVAIAALLGGNFVIFTYAGWVPVVQPLLGLVFAGGSVVAYKAFQSKQQQEEIKHKAQEQENAIILLKALLRDGGGVTSTNISVVDQPQPGNLLNQRYRITELLSSGGFSQTYLAEDIQHPGNPQCVVKHLQPAREDAQFLEVARRLFKTEAEILELLGQHDQIPQFLAYFEENQQFYLLQEFIQGHSLSQELSCGKCLSEAYVVDLLKDVLEVLVFVHSNYVIHRDIKPSNLIRRERDHRLVLIDFGAVKQLQPQQMEEESHTVAIGTAGYTPPEQLLGHPRLNSDIYALGMLGIQALTGIPTQQFQRDSKTGILVWQAPAKTRKELAAVLDKMVSFDYSSRYQSAAEVLQSLEHL